MSSQKAVKVAKNLGIDPKNLTDMGHGYYSAWINFTPKLAAEILEKCNTNNRNVKMTKVDQMKSDMINKRWIPNHQGIAFGLDGELKDGQHRLIAIIRSNTNQRLLTIIGVSDEVKQVIDQGVSRTTLDVAKFKGVEKLQLNRRLVIAKAIESGIGSHNISYSSQSAISHHDTYEELIDFVLQQFPRQIPGITAAPVMGTIARAYDWNKRHGNDLGFKRLIQFCDIMKTGDWKGQQSNLVVQKLRDNFIRNKYSGGSEKQKQYRLVQYVLFNYLNKKPTTRLKEATKEFFPLKKEEDEPKSISVA